MSIIFSVQDGQPVVAVDQSTEYLVLETRKSYVQTYFDLQADRSQVVENALQEQARQAGDQYGFNTRFVIVTASANQTVPASPPMEYLMYVQNTSNPQLSNEELTAKFGWNPTMSTVIPITVNLAVPFYNE